MPASVTVQGSSLAGAACAHQLTQSGIPLQVVAASNPATGLRVVSTAVLHGFPLIDRVSSQGIAQIVNRRLREDDAIDSTLPTGDLVVAHQGEIVDALLKDVTVAPPSNQQAAHAWDVLLEANDLRLGDPRLFDAEATTLSGTRICIYLEWPGNAGDDARLVRLTGESLSDVRGHAWIMAGMDATVLALVLPLAALVETAIALPDVLSRLLSHPDVICELPNREPSAAYTRLLSDRQPAGILAREGIRLRIGAAVGLVHPICLDAELCSGRIAGTHVAAAITGNRLSIARLSRIQREWRSVDTEFHPS